MMAPSNITNALPQAFQMPRMDAGFPMNNFIGKFMPQFSSAAPVASQAKSAAAQEPVDLAGSLRPVLDQIRSLGVDPSSLTMQASREELKFSFSYEEESLKMDSAGSLNYQARSLSVDVNISSLEGEFSSKDGSVSFEGFSLKLEMQMEEISVQQSAGDAAPAEGASSQDAMASLKDIIGRFFEEQAAQAGGAGSVQQPGNVESATDGMLSSIGEMGDSMKELGAKIMDILKKLNEVMEQLKKKSAEESGLYDRNGNADFMKMAGQRLASLMNSFKVEVKSIELGAADQAEAAPAAADDVKAPEAILEIAAAPVDSYEVKPSKADAGKPEKVEEHKSEKAVESHGDRDASKVKASEISVLESS